MTTVMFWSPYGVHGRTAFNAAVTAITASLQYRLRLLLCHNQCRHYGIEAGVLSTDILMNYAHKKPVPGIDRLHYLYKSGILTRSNVSDYMIPLFRDRLDLLIGTDKEGDIQPNDPFWEFLFCTAGQDYDLILMDAGSGIKQMPLLAEADLVVVDLGQDIIHLKAFYDEYANTEVIRSKLWIPVIGAYQPESLLIHSNNIRQLGIQQNVYRLNYYQDFQDAWNTQKLISFLRHCLILDRTNTDSAELLRQSFFLTAAILEQLGGVSVISGSVVKLPVST